MRDSFIVSPNAFTRSSIRARPAASALSPTGSMAVLITLAVTVSMAVAQPLATNIVVNGRGEIGSAAVDATGVVTPPGWSGRSNITQVHYGSSGGAFLNTLSARPADAGLTFFAGGPSSAQSSMIQRIDFSQRAVQIDAGVVTADFAAWLGGADSDEDTVLAFCTFLDSAGFSLGTLQLNGPNSLQRGGITLLTPHRASGAVPPSARVAEIIILFSRATGSYNNGYADSVSLILQAPCRSDINLDGGIDGMDVDAFFMFWVAAMPQADFNGDGGVDGADVGAFFTAWEQAAC